MFHLQISSFILESLHRYIIAQLEKLWRYLAGCLPSQYSCLTYSALHTELLDHYFTTAPFTYLNLSAALSIGRYTLFWIFLFSDK